MPALFDRTPVPQAGRRHRRRTVVVSVALHAALLVVIVVTQLGAAFDHLDVNRRLDLFVLPAPAPPPPEVSAAPAAPTTVAAASPDAAPIEANDLVLPEPPPRPAVRGPVVPGALPTGPAGVPPSTRGGDGQAVTLAAPPRPPDPIRPGGDVSFPERTTYVPPVYPEVARAARVEGTVILEATIDAAGVVRDVRVLRSVPLLDQAAIAAVRQWRYRPTHLNGVPVPVLLTVTVTFTMRQ
jgi:protein TonB